MVDDMIYQERRRRFASLVHRYGGQAEAAEALGFGSPGAVSNYKLRKNMGEEVARRVETLANLPPGSLLDPVNVPWLWDTPLSVTTSDSAADHTTDDIVRAQRILAGVRDQYVYVQSHELWRSDVSTEIRFMNVPKVWLDIADLEADTIKSMEMPDDSQADRIKKGDHVAINVEWGDTLVNDETYAIRIGGVYTLRRIAWQANGGLVLRCRNDEYSDEIVAAEDVVKLDVLGVFACFQSTSSW